MKKVLSIVLAIVMVLSVSVVAFADDEVLFSEEVDFFVGNWVTATLENSDDFLEALQVEGAQLVLTRSTNAGIVYEDDGPYENYLLFDSWYQGGSYIWLGTGGHSTADEPGKADEGMIDCLEDDGINIYYDANTVYAALEAAGDIIEYDSIMVISNVTDDASFRLVTVSVILPESAAEETAEEAEASEAEETAEASESTETSTASSPDTGVALALVPMAIAGIAVVSSKRR